MNGLTFKKLIFVTVKLNFKIYFVGYLFLTVVDFWEFWFSYDKLIFETLIFGPKILLDKRICLFLVSKNAFI